MSEICISESTPPTVTKRASQFRRPLLRRKGAQLNSTSHFPTPLQSEHGYDFVDQRTSSSGGGNSAAAQLRECNPFLCRTAAELSPPELRGGMEEKGIVLPELSCRTAAVWPPSKSPGRPVRQLRRGEHGGKYGSLAPGVQFLCRSSWTSVSQGQSSFPPIPLNHGRDVLHYESILVVEVPETSEAVFVIHNIIRGTHSFWP